MQNFKDFIEDRYDLWQSESERVEIARLGEHLNLSLHSQLYIQARTFAHLIDANEMFIAGEIRQSLYHGKLDPETKLLNEDV